MFTEKYAENVQQIMQSIAWNIAKAFNKPFHE